MIRIKGRDQLLAAYRILDKLPGTWHSRGPAETPTLLVLESHYQALVEAGVVAPNGKEGKARAKKKPAKDHHA
jgi:hypothetical protein